MSTEAENTYSLYGCALAICLNGLIGGLGMWNIGDQNSKRPEGTGVPQGRHDLKARTFYIFKENSVEVSMVSSWNAVTVIFMPEI